MTTGTETRMCAECEYLLTEADEQLDLCPSCGKPLQIRQDVMINVTMPPMFGDGGLPT